ncbi:aminotransferase class I/II-fold pyridoxal phosphate-dependent enzyme [Desulfoscipio sp. XC116]|uniref:aminotransferase class I/II-fold pyridoxal phosphate-dependent enzyme n=1 Tax=Desulfoscipio sp. XC116 TaxID=3144975 RepID=UPI00325AF95B
MSNQQNAPIIDALKRYINDKVIRFHMPGHKGRQLADSLLNDLLGSRVFAADVTNVPGLDDLHQTHGVIKEAQEMAAAAFGADHSYFLVNGSSCGLQALIMAVCNQGDRILVPRNMHRSILSGIILSGAVPVYFKPEYDDGYGLFLGASPETIAGSLDCHPEVKAVILVSPTYHGITSNVARIAAIVHARNIPLLIDEAHGPHLHFHEALPRTALEEGADASVQGIHKILAAFTQASMLHIKGNIIDKYKLEACLRLLQSTSTSYLLLASLDAARAQIAARGKQLIQIALELSDYLRQEIVGMTGFSVLGPDIVGQKGVWGLDPTKITISVKGLGVTGLWAERWLREKHHIQIEMSDIFNLLLIIGFGNSRTDTQHFLKALHEMRKYIDQNPIRSYHSRALREGNIMPEIPELVISPREAFGAPTLTLPLNEAVGRISTEAVACYPPGIPVLCPGERVSGEIIDYLTAKRNLGVHFQGCSDLNVYTLRVVR